jgi:hypothetical protein
MKKQIKKMNQVLAEIPNLAALKQKYGQLFWLKINGKLFVFRKPNLAEYGLFQKHMQDNPAKSQEVIVRNCLIYGDKELIMTVDYFKETIAIIEKLFAKFEVEVGEV